MPKHINRVGERYGSLVVLSINNINKNIGSVWNVRCDCGVEKTVRSSNLSSGSTVRCSHKCPLRPDPKLKAASTDKSKNKLLTSRTRTPRSKSSGNTQDHEDDPQPSSRMKVTLPIMPWDKPKQPRL